MVVVLIVLLFIHAIAHLPGFIVGWDIAPVAELPYRTTIIGGIDVGATGMRLFGTLWLLLSIAFIVVAAGAWFRVEWWPLVALSAVALSLMLCIAELPNTRFGILANGLVILLTLVVQMRADRLANAGGVS